MQSLHDYLSGTYIVYNDGKRFEGLCSCGFHTTKKTYICPQCEAKYSKYFHSNNYGGGFTQKTVTKKAHINNHKSITTAVELGRIVFNPKAPQDMPVFTYEKKEIRETVVEVGRQRNLSIKINGKGVQATQSNIKKGFAYLSGRHVHGTIFSAISGNLMTEKLSDAIDYLFQYPWTEKFYEADHEMKIIRFIHLHEFMIEFKMGDATEPHKILKLSKSLYALCVKNSYAFCRIHFCYNRLMNFVEHYGIDKTQTILTYALNLRKRDAPQIPSNYLKLLTMEYMHYDPKELYEYLGDRIYTYQGIENPQFGGQLLIDYLGICAEMNVKPEKYPRSLHLVHDLAAKNYKVALNERQKQKFTEAVSEYQDLSYQGATYSVVTPKDIDDLIHEGSSLNHCVGSYAEKIIDRIAKILFLRKNSCLNEPLVTIDVRDNSVLQAAGHGNRELTPEESSFLSSWAKKKNLTYCA